MLWGGHQITTHPRWGEKIIIIRIAVASVQDKIPVKTACKFQKGEELNRKSLHAFVCKIFRECPPASVGLLQHEACLHILKSWKSKATPGVKAKGLGGGIWGRFNPQIYAVWERQAWHYLKRFNPSSASFCFLGRGGKKITRFEAKP